MSESRNRARHAGTTAWPQPQPVAAAVSDTEEIILTVDKATHQVVKIARLDQTGQRYDLSQEQTAELAGKDFLGEVRHTIDNVYRAGLAEGLGAESDEEDAADDVLIRLLVGRSVERHVPQMELRDVLLRPILLRRLLRDRVGAAPKALQLRRQPITDLPQNGSASKN